MGLWGPKITAEVGRPWLDPALDAVVAEVEPVLRPHAKVDPDRLDPATPAVAAAVDRVVDVVASLRGEPQRQLALLRPLSEVLPAGAGHLLNRADAAVQDQRDEADLRALAGWAMVGVAWQIRTSARAKDVPRHRWVPFADMVNRADAQNVTALERIPGHPIAATSRLSTGLGSGHLDSAGWQERFEAATETEPTLFPAHEAMLYALTPKWYGSLEVMFDFARRVAREAPPGDPVTAMLPLAHLYSMDACRFGTHDVAQWLAALKEGLAEVHAARERWLAGRSPAEAGRAHPFGLDANQLFGWAYSIVAKDLAREHFAVGLGRVATMPWSLLGDPAAAYLEMVTSLKVKKSS